jgi:peptidoglycan/LPS O-acetylase OafA/YrhL
MSRSLSIFLDALRFLAALMVVVGHFTQPIFSQGFPDLTLWAVSAVSVFFVLSGFVISHVTTLKEKDPLDYTAARIARLYSVLVPALLLTAIVHLVAVKLDPAYVAQWVDVTALSVAIPHPLPRFAILNLITLTFLNGVHGHDFSVPLDNPVWSLGFEAPYYALFGIALFTRGVKRWAMLGICCLVFGYGILSVLPVWLSGVALHRLTLRIKLSSARSTAVAVLAIAAVIAIIACIHPYLDWVNAPHGPIYHALAHPKGRADAAPVFFFWGLITWLAILAAFAAEQMLRRVLIPLEKPIRWCASHTFSLYLFHFPLLVFVYVTTHYNRASHTAQAGVFATVLLACVLLSKISEEKKGWWRKSVRHALSRLLPAR